jgi:hypothetical protein
MKAAKARPRKETKVSHLTLFFPITNTVGTIGIYKFDTTGLRLVRVLTGCRMESRK